MLLLSIDTSGKLGSIALAKVGERSGNEHDFELIETVPLAGGTFSAQLIPQIAALLSVHRFTQCDIGSFAVATGPGSFTGLRVGLAAVKGLAEVLSKPIAAVSILEVCAFASSAKGRVMSALDAGRGDVYVGEYEIPAKGRQVPREQLLSRSEFLVQAKGWMVVTPDVNLIEVIRADRAAKDPLPAMDARSGASSSMPVLALAAITAADVARLGWGKLEASQTVTPEQLEANYIRRTDAEMLQKLSS